MNQVDGLPTSCPVCKKSIEVDDLQCRLVGLAPNLSTKPVTAWRLVCKECNNVLGYTMMTAVFSYSITVNIEI
jgi:hypothetical protein